MQRLPPLTALRTFEAAARLRSFTKAAAELHVTQSAVSRQIKVLEDDLGLALFRRGHRKVRLTSDGERLLPVLTRSFADIQQTVERLRLPEQDVKLKLPPTFAIRWLIPRLARFESEHPDIQLRLTSSVRPIKLGKEPFDVGVVYVRGTEPGRKGDSLLVDRVVPVASRTYLEVAPPLHTAADIRHHRLLSSHVGAWEWRRWARAFEVDDLPLDDVLALQPTEAAIQAARSGQGVALANTTFVARERAEGELIVPLDVPALEQGMWLAVYARAVLSDPCVHAFREWLLHEAAAGGEG